MQGIKDLACAGAALVGGADILLALTTTVGERVQFLSTSANTQRAWRVVYDGLNLALGEGTGIATYTRVLSYLARSLGYDIGIIYGASLPTHKNSILQEVLFFDQMRGPKRRTTSFPRGLYNKFVDYLSYFSVIHPSSLRLGNVVIKEQLKDLLPELDRAFFVRNLFDNAGRFFRQTGRLVRMSLDTQPDIFHFTYPVPIKGTSGCTIYTIHDLMPLRLPFTTLDNKRHTLNLLKTLARTADHIVTVSENSRQDIIRLLGVNENRVTNTYQAVTFPQKYLQRSEAMVANFLEGQYGLEMDGYLIFFGALEPKKNIGRLIDGFLLSGVDIPLVLVMGQGWDNAVETARLSEHRATPRGQTGSTIRSLNYVDRSTLLSLIRGARASIPIAL